MADRFVRVLAQAVGMPMTGRTWQGPVVELPQHEGLDAPVPAEGCDVCAALASQRAEAQRAGDVSQVVDCDVELRRHPHRRRRGPQ